MRWIWIQPPSHGHSIHYTRQWTLLAIGIQTLPHAHTVQKSMTSVGESAHSHIHMHTVYRTKGFEHCFRPRYLKVSFNNLAFTVISMMYKCRLSNVRRHWGVMSPSASPVQVLLKRKIPTPHQRTHSHTQKSTTAKHCWQCGWINKMIIRIFACFF